MKRLSLGVLAFVAPFAVLAQTTVFEDTFNNSSTINGAVGGASGGNSTSYQLVAGNTGATASIAAGDMTITSQNTSAVITEVQALFASSPIALTSAGWYVDFALTFRPTSGNILNSSGTVTAESLVLGLFNSGGVAPLQGLSITSNGNAPATGGAQNWTGYFGRIISSGSANIVTRPMQTGATSQNQDLLFNNASSGTTFHFPTGTSIGAKNTSASPVYLTTGNTYTVDLRITFDGTTMVVSNALYNGLNTGSTPIFTDISTGGTLATAGAAQSFDGLARREWLI
jgi:hypothetical protein